MSEHFARGLQPRFRIPQILGGDIQVAHRAPSLNSKNNQKNPKKEGASQGQCDKQSGACRQKRFTENSHSAFRWGTRA
jgi:hypothetical protein